MKKRLSTSASQDNIEQLLLMLQTAPEQLRRMQERLSPVQLEAPLAPGEWSPRRIMAHLLNCEARGADPIYRALLLPQPLLPRIHAERDWGKLMRYEQFDFGEMLTYFSFRRRVLLGLLRNLDENGWARAVRREGKQRPETVYYLARGLATHESEHLQHLADKLGLSDCSS